LNDAGIREAYERARDRYASFGVDTDVALLRLSSVPLSLPVWQADDVTGFETSPTNLSGGIVVTGRRAGRPRSLEELQDDLRLVFGLLPGRHRLNLHAIYGDFGGRSIDRDRIGPEHFRGWADWAASLGIKLDFNATCFSHPKAEAGFTLASADPEVRRFWIEHCRRSREIAADLGRRQGSFAIHNLWVPDGCKDAPLDRFERRRTLLHSLDEVFRDEHPASALKDAVESKLFGIGSESFVAGSHELYLAYAVQRGKMVCLDLGHFHPTESVADKISAILLFCDELLLHVSRGVRWDSDHVVILDDAVRAVAEEIVRADALSRVHIALDFFDGSVNRPGALVLGARSVLRALLVALLEPGVRLAEFQRQGDTLGQLALADEAKTLPWGPVWDFHCLVHDVPVAEAWISIVSEHERRARAARGAGR
jgi:L-rhamnose isomerase